MCIKDITKCTKTLKMLPEYLQSPLHVDNVSITVRVLQFYYPSVNTDMDNFLEFKNSEM